MTSKMVEKDERTTFIENKSFKYGYNFITFSLLFDTVYRAIKFEQAAWDLLAIVIIGGFIMTIYQYKNRIIGKPWMKGSIITFIIGFTVTIIIVLLSKRFNLF